MRELILTKPKMVDECHFEFETSSFPGKFGIGNLFVVFQGEINVRTLCLQTK